MFKRVSSIQPWLKMGRNGKWRWSATWLSIVCNNLLSRVPGIRRRKPSNLLLYRKSCEVWGKNPLNMKCFNRPVDAFDLLLLSVVVYQKVLTTGHAIFADVFTVLGMFLASLLYERKCLRIDLLKINCCLNVLFIIWFPYVLNSVTSALQCGSCRAFIVLAERMAYLS